MNKEVKAFVRDLERLGFDCEVGAHVKVRLNGKPVLVIGSSPSDRRWRKNSIRDLKRKTGIVL